MRCPDCEKFVSYDTDVEPEFESEPEVEGRTFKASVNRVLACGECGTELKALTMEVEQDLELKVPEAATAEELAKAEAGCDDDEHEWLELDALSAEATTGKGTYGVEVSGDISCGKCGLTASVFAKADHKPSEFEEVC